MTDYEIEILVDAAEVRDVRSIHEKTIDKLTVSDLERLFNRCREKMYELTGVNLDPVGRYLEAPPGEEDLPLEYCDLLNLMGFVNLTLQKHRREGATVLESLALLQVNHDNPNITKGLNSDALHVVYARIVGTTTENAKKTTRSRVDKKDLANALEFINQLKSRG